jgi:hypothetical protein
LEERETSGAAPSEGRIQVFASFDVDHDTELYELLHAQAAVAGSNFTVSGGSRPYAGTDAWREGARRRIREADQVIVVCGEFTDGAIGVFSEVQIAQEERKPYLLLWGRREGMCTMPAGAKSAEAMYSWTRPILQDQIDRISRLATKEAEAKEAVLHARSLRGQAS